MDKRLPPSRLYDILADGQTIMIGGFCTVGVPETLIDAILEKGVKNLTVISNDTGYPGQSVGRLVAAGALKRFIGSHIGTNKTTMEQLVSGNLEVTFIPQGTLAERIRCGGAGLGGFMTRVGLGTSAAEGKKTMTIDGREYLIEAPLRADISLVKCHTADSAGNLIYRRTARNFNQVMATAGDFVAAEAEIIVRAGTLDPDSVMTPHIYTDMVVKSGEVL